MLVLAGEAVARRAPDEPLRVKIQVEGRTREALLYVPSKTNNTPEPVIFAFHGHGGTAQHAARVFGFQQHWPEAVVVYMQGIPTPGRLTDPQGKRNGWQHAMGEHGDRDLEFFDALLAKLRDKRKIDDSRIYATGHSNGGAFTYLLWAARPDVFAAFAPCASASRLALGLSPKPAMHIAGERDALVRFEWQQRTMAIVRRRNGCTAAGREWAKHCTLYPSANGAPFIAFIHPGTHKYPAEAPPLIVRFFKEHALAPAKK